ncbi:single-stranded DNA-binding protein [Xanthobacter oligotrophicus]|uniref:Single-stranded DNA-binding protein n=1 Tax=Xanthobacter oligotrophicus TaxID=2607286 RepID=A0ABW6ZRL2_9HYPH
MAGSVNKAIIVGNLGRDPEVKSFANGGRLANLSVATSETWRDKTTGERKERTEWHRVVIFNEALVGVAEKFLRKGSKVYIEGQIETRKYEKDGRETYTTEVVLRPYHGELQLLDKQDSGPPSGSPDDYSRSDPPRGGSPSRPSQEMDDEIPL